MTIKKPMKPAPAGVTTVGGATISDRFKLDLTEPEKKTYVNGPETTVAAVAGGIALIVAGILTYMLYQHWEFLMPA